MNLSSGDRRTINAQLLTRCFADAPSRISSPHCSSPFSPRWPNSRLLQRFIYSPLFAFSTSVEFVELRIFFFFFFLRGGSVFFAFPRSLYEWVLSRSLEETSFESRKEILGDGTIWVKKDWVRWSVIN